MKFRSLAAAFTLTALTLAPVPAAARDKPIARMTEQLSDPAVQQNVANAMAAMTAALMSIKLAPFADAMDQMGDKKSARRIDRNATLGDMAGRDAKRVPHEISRRVPQMMGAMAGMAGAMEAMLPQLEAIGQQMGTAMDKAADSSAATSDDPPAGEATEE